MTHARSEFLAGVRDELPILLGVAPFGMIYGALAVAAGLPTAAAQAMSAIVFAGSAQFILTQLIATGTPPAVLVLTVFVVNLRHMLYSASIAPYVQGLSRKWRWLLSYLLTDEAYIVAITHYQQGNGRHRRDAEAATIRGNHADTEKSIPPRPQCLSGESPRDRGTDKRHWYFLGAGLALWSCWQASTAIGIFLGAQVPPSWSLDFTLPLTFIALVFPALVDRPAVAAALSAGVVGVIGAGWPYKTGLVAAALVGIAVGVWLDGKKRRRGGYGNESAGLTESTQLIESSEQDSIHPVDSLFHPSSGES